MDIFKEIFTTEGRINRWRYIKYMLILAVSLGMAKFVTSCMATFLTGDPNGSLVMMLTLMWALIAGAGNVMLIIRHLHDLNKSGYFLILTFVPVVNILFSIYLFCAKGTDGWNRYGADPLQE